MEGTMSLPDAESDPLTCREAIGLLAEYLESVLSPAQIGRFEAHLAGCEPCLAYLRTYRRTKELTAETERVAMPEEMRNRLRQLLVRALSGD